MSKEHWVWLGLCLGPATVNIDKILDTFCSAEAVYEQRNENLFEDILSNSQIEKMHTITLEDAIEHIEFHREKGIEIVSVNEEEYPELLVKIHNPPVILYYKGDLNLIKSKITVGVIGTRKPSAYGIEATKFISEGLAAKDVCLISGLAYGLDSEAHKACVRANVPTVAVLGNSVDVYYPARNRQLQELIERNGVVISEYAVGFPVGKSSFLARNRIIAGISKGLCVAEARSRSGTMSTVKFAMEFNRDLFAVPGGIFSPLSEGTLKMLKEGAFPLTSADDVLKHYGLIGSEEEEKKKKSPKTKIRLSDKEKIIFDVLGVKAIPVGEICAKTNLGVGEILANLSSLEMNGIVIQEAGRRFAKKI